MTHARPISCQHPVRRAARRTIGPVAAAAKPTTTRWSHRGTSRSRFGPTPSSPPEPRRTSWRRSGSRAATAWCHPAGDRPRRHLGAGRGAAGHTAGLDECVVHPEGWARVGAGVKWLRVVEAAAPYGLAPLSGSITDVGIVGYTTGGGLGPMARTYGLASDRVRAIEVVTGDGELRRATPTEHPDLFFGLRGGKGALGIVTADRVRPGAPAELLRRRPVVRRRCTPRRDRAVAGVERRAARGGHHVVRAVPAAGDARCAAAAGGPADAVGALRLDRGRRPREPAGSPRCERPRRCCIDDVARQALHRNRFRAHRSAGSGAGQRGRRGAHRFPGGGRRGAARGGRPGLDVAADPGGGPADGWRHRARPASTTARSARARPRIGARRRHRRSCPACRTTPGRCSPHSRPWTGGHRLPNFTFDAADLPVRL